MNYTTPSLAKTIVPHSSIALKQTRLVKNKELFMVQKVRDVMKCANCLKPSCCSSPCQRWGGLHFRSSSTKRKKPVSFNYRCSKIAVTHCVFYGGSILFKQSQYVYLRNKSRKGLLPLCMRKSVDKKRHHKLKSWFAKVWPICYTDENICVQKSLTCFLFLSTFFHISRSRIFVLVKRFYTRQYQVILYYF